MVIHFYVSCIRLLQICIFHVINSNNCKVSNHQKGQISYHQWISLQYSEHAQWVLWYQGNDNFYHIFCISHSWICTNDVINSRFHKGSLVISQLPLLFPSSSGPQLDYHPSSYPVSFLLVCLQLFVLLSCFVCDGSVVRTLFDVVDLSEQTGIMVVSTVMPHPSWVLTHLTKQDTVLQLIHIKISSTHSISHLWLFLDFLSSSFLLLHLYLVLSHLPNQSSSSLFASSCLILSSVALQVPSLVFSFY